MKPKIYMASKLKHFAKWRVLKENRSDFIFTSTWFYEAHIEAETEAQGFGSSAISKEKCELVWIINDHDVKICDFLIVYSEECDRLKGALIEAGLAIAYGKRVIVVGQNTDYGTWQFHPSVTRVDTIEEALEHVKFSNRKT